MIKVDGTYSLRQFLLSSHPGMTHRFLHCIHILQPDPWWFHKCPNTVRFQMVWLQEKKRIRACLIVATWGFIQVKQQTWVFLLDIGDKTISNETGELLKPLFSCVQRKRQRKKKQKSNKGYYNSTVSPE